LPVPLGKRALTPALQLCKAPDAQRCECAGIPA